MESKPLHEVSKRSILFRCSCFISIFKWSALLTVFSLAILTLCHAFVCLRHISVSSKGMYLFAVIKELSVELLRDAGMYGVIFFKCTRTGFFFTIYGK